MGHICSLDFSLHADGNIPISGLEARPGGQTLGKRRLGIRVVDHRGGPLTLEAVVVPQHTQASAYFGAWGPNYLSYYLVFMLLGIFIGGLASAVISRRIHPTVERGQACGVKQRVIYALVGGVLVGFASRLAQGCTSGQALTGGAMLLTGSLVFMVCLFASGYAAASFFRRQWHD